MAKLRSFFGCIFVPSKSKCVLVVRNFDTQTRFQVVKNHAACMLFDPVFESWRTAFCISSEPFLIEPGFTRCRSMQETGHYRSVMSGRQIRTAKNKPAAMRPVVFTLCWRQISDRRLPAILHNHRATADRSILPGRLVARRTPSLRRKHLH